MLWLRVRLYLFLASHPVRLAQYLAGRRRVEFTPNELISLVPEVQWVIEAGANNGSDTERFLETWASAHVLACEPIPELAECARRRLALYGDRVQVLEVALAEEGMSTVSLKADGAKHDSASILDPTLHRVAFPNVAFTEEVEASAMTLDGVWEYAGCPRVDLLWLDLQGYELQALRSGLRMLASVQVLVIEVSLLPLYRGAPTSRQVRSFLHAQGFELKEERVPLLSGNALYTNAHAAPQSLAKPT